MRVTVFGGTGAIGRQVVSQLLDADHEVTAHVRNPDKVPGLWGGRVGIVVGDLADVVSVNHAVAAGGDAVISTLGPPLRRPRTTAEDRSGSSLADGVGGIVKAMHAVAPDFDTKTQLSEAASCWNAWSTLCRFSPRSCPNSPKSTKSWPR